MASKFKVNDEVVVKAAWADTVVAGIVVQVKSNRWNPERKYRVHLVEPFKYGELDPPLSVLWFEGKDLELFS